MLTDKLAVALFKETNELVLPKLYDTQVQVDYKQCTATGDVLIMCTSISRHIFSNCTFCM